MWEHTQKCSLTNSITFAVSLRCQFLFNPMVYQTTMIGRATGVWTAQEMPRQSSWRSRSTTNRKSPMVEDEDDGGKFRLASLPNILLIISPKTLLLYKVPLAQLVAKVVELSSCRRFPRQLHAKIKGRRPQLLRYQRIPMAILQKANRKANKVLMDWSFALLIALVLLPSVNVNSLSNTVGEHSDQEYWPNPVRAELKDIFFQFVLSLSRYWWAITIAHSALQKMTGRKRKAGDVEDGKFNSSHFIQLFRANCKPSEGHHDMFSRMKIHNLTTPSPKSVPSITQCITMPGQPSIVSIDWHEGAKQYFCLW